MAEQQTDLARLIVGGDGERGATEGARGIYVSSGISNAYLVTTDEGASS